MTAVSRSNYSATEAWVITPSDSEDLIQETRAVYVGGTGDLRVQFVSGGTITLVGAQGGMFYPIRVRKVLSTGTSASNIVGLA